MSEDHCEECGHFGISMVVGMSGGRTLCVSCAEISDATRIESLEDENRGLRHELAGLHGERDGLMVSAGFFERRCEVLEKAVVDKLSSKEAESLAGICPLCMVSRIEQYADALERLQAKYDRATARIDELNASLNDLAMRATVDCSGCKQPRAASMVDSDGYCVVCSKQYWESRS